MKKLFALIAALVLFASVSSAGVLDKVKYYGEGSFYGVSQSNQGATILYGTLGIESNVYENITAAFALGYTHLWGDNINYSMTGKPITDAANEGLLNNLIIVEANVAFDKLFDLDGLKLKVGRQFYGDDGSMIIYIGVRKDNPVLAVLSKKTPSPMSHITSADAAVLYYDNKNIKANIMFATVENNWGAASILNENMTIRGFDFKYLNIANMIDLQAYFYDAENVLARHYNVFGMKGTFHKEMGENKINASIEAAKGLAGGSILSNDVDENDTGFIKLDASFNMAKIGITPRLTYGLFGFGKYEVGGVTHYDKEFWAFGNYGPWLIADYDFSDLQLLNLGCDYTLKKFTVSFDWYNFSAVNSKWKATNEIDFQAKYAYTENVDFNIGIAHFFSDKSEFDVAYMHAGLSYKF